MHPFILSAQTYIKRHILVILVVLFVALLAMGYLLGYRPGPSFTFVRAGTLVLSNVPTGASVYADETKRAVGHGGDVRIALVPGTHSIIVDAKGNNPWSDAILVDAAKETIVHPILIPLVVQRQNIPVDDRSRASAALAAYVLPDAKHPLALEGGCATVYVEDNRLVADATTTAPGCSTPPSYLCVGGTCATTVLFAPRTELRSVLPFPGRQDAVIVAYGNTLAVLELNPLSPQYFAPLLVGVLPTAAVWTPQSIVVHDDGQTFSIAF
jgi:hypothetical protein